MSVKSIVENAACLLTDRRAYAGCQIDRGPYGGGHAAQRIVDLMLKQGWEEKTARISSPSK